MLNFVLSFFRYILAFFTGKKKESVLEVKEPILPETPVYVKDEPLSVLKSDLSDLVESSLYDVPKFWENLDLVYKEVSEKLPEGFSLRKRDGGFEGICPFHILHEKTRVKFSIIPVADGAQIKRPFLLARAPLAIGQVEAIVDKSSTQGLFAIAPTLIRTMTSISTEGEFFRVPSFSHYKAALDLCRSERSLEFLSLQKCDQCEAAKGKLTPDCPCLQVLFDKFYFMGAVQATRDPLRTREAFRRNSGAMDGCFISKYGFVLFENPVAEWCGDIELDAPEELRCRLGSNLLKLQEDLGIFKVKGRLFRIVQDALGDYDLERKISPIDQAQAAFVARLMVDLV